VRQVIVDSEDLEEEADGARAARHGQRPTVASGVVGGFQHQAHASDVDEVELVEVEHDVLVAIAESMKALGDRGHRGDVELSLKLDPRACAFAGFNDVQG